MKTNEWFLISSVSKKVNIPPETVRRYARQYGEYLQLTRGEKNSYLVHESSFETIIQIRSLLEQGYQHEQVKKLLSKMELLEDQPDDEKEKKETANDAMVILPEEHMEMLKELRTLGEQNKKIIHLLGHMHERMNRYEEFLLTQQALIDEQTYEQERGQRDYERKRDEYLMKTMNELQEIRKENTVTKEKESLFIKLFKR